MASDLRSVSFRITIEYDGGDFHGWQFQPSHRTVQGDLEEALRQLGEGPVRVAGAGRTDAGCHAVGQVASVTLRTRLSAERLRLAVNAHLAHDVRVVGAAEVGPDFHARFDAMRRAYRYLIAPAPTAIRRRHSWILRVNAGTDALNATSGPLLGSHDFTTFSRQGNEGAGPCCRVTRACWSGRRGRLRFDIEADRFLYTMVRRIVSTVIRATEHGAGARGVRDALEARDRRAAAPAAPAHGLYLMRVRYPRVGWIPKEPLNVIA